MRMNRRKFLGEVGMATAAASVLGNASAAPANTGPTGNSPGSVTGGSRIERGRVLQAYNIRVAALVKDARTPVPPHTTNGDELRYADKSASYSKGLLQDDIGVVNPAAWQSFKKALQSGSSIDWEAIITGGPRTQNDPQGAYAFDLESLDSVQYGNAPAFDSNTPVVPPFDQITSESYGTQLMELYWASLLRDVAFTDYAGNTTAQEAAAELTAAKDYRGPRDSNGHVTPELLFRGTLPGETVGPCMSQFMILPTRLGQQPIDQLMITYLPGVDYMTDTHTFQQVQNGIPTGFSNQADPVRRYLRNGRDLCAWTHTDVAYQGYLVAMLILGTLRAPLNPGNPYAHSKTQNGFCSFGGADIAAAMGESSNRALQKVWYQKWLVHLTHRPESGAGLVQQILSGNGGRVQAHPNSNVLNSKAVAQSFSKYGTYLLSQAFPEGSPTHPSYPTGHGAVAGACITLLKFFFDQNYVIPDPMVPASGGESLVPYTGADAGEITVGGELNKLARNISFGHGVHAGIHWRTDTDSSMTLGEAIAISMLRDRAQCYNEKFSVTFTRLDGSDVTISNS